ncbi:PadR family transcriptional regulator [Bifidobacterium sp. ESL0790]|uniref:PadR family transcriptional regulator n=1 Tax=Bifidobacterium sp. ESL0790 TaxID=2983233 RepID=UPI0023F9036F|nr:PadR family transcriptional regulator [Bifidobacterium sp. ESL0790]WEV72370.1 PadR family transcriptional regulator [Bifidobacterium sp. ESL0790]
MVASPIELMILGALKDHSMSAYDINKFLLSRGVSNWVKISEQSVYRVSLKLNQEGFTAIARDGSKTNSSSSKRVYTITTKGLSRFDELMREIAAEPPHVQFDFIAVIANLYQTDEATGHKLLTTLETNHRNVANWLRSSVAGMPFSEASETVTLCADTYDLIARWAKHFQDNFYTEHSDAFEDSRPATSFDTFDNPDDSDEDEAAYDDSEPMDSTNDSYENPMYPFANKEGQDDGVYAANLSNDRALKTTHQASQPSNETDDQPSTHGTDDNETRDNRNTVYIQGTPLTAGKPITNLDLRLRSLAGRVHTEPCDRFEVRFHHCRAKDFRIVNEDGTLRIVNTGTPWDTFSLFDTFNPARWNAHVEVVVPESAQLAEANFELHSAGLSASGLHGERLNLNLHSSSAKIERADTVAANLDIHSGSMKWNGTIHDAMNLTCHSGSARVTGLPEGFGYRTNLRGSSLRINGTTLIDEVAGRNTSRPGTPMLTLDLHSSSAVVE